MYTFELLLDSYMCLTVIPSILNSDIRIRFGIHFDTNLCIIIYILNYVMDEKKKIVDKYILRT